MITDDMMHFQNAKLFPYELYLSEQGNLIKTHVYFYPGGYVIILGFLECKLDWNYSFSINTISDKVLYGRSLNINLHY